MSIASVSRVLCLVCLCLGAGGALSQTAVPDTRFVVTQDVDYYGADLTNLFDTGFDGCARACQSDAACVAFTFNTRSNACFPKSAITARKPYAGALSAQRVATDPAIVSAAPARQADLSFLVSADIDAAQAQSARLPRSYPAGGLDLADLRALGRDRMQAGDAEGALRWHGLAVALSDLSRDWRDYAAVLLALDGRDTTPRRRITDDALSASVNAYLRALDPPSRASALTAMARALERASRGRHSIAALRLAQQIAPQSGTRQMLDRAVAQFGFRITDTRVENDAAEPRICIEFSDPLVQAGVDYAPFIRSPDTGLVVTAQDAQLCLDGVAHGTRYDLTVRSGLPAANGEVLGRDAALSLYVRDRAPLVRFGGRAFVLPRGAGAAIPVETVNTDALDLTLWRISDRNLVRAVQDSFLGRPLSAYQRGVFATEIAQEIWSGTAEVQNTLNADMTTRLPLHSALKDQAPGIFALTARLPGVDLDDDAGATQWFVLSDLGLATWFGTDGLHVAVRGLGDAGPRADVTVSLISRANAVLGRATTDRDGFASFPPGLARGVGAAGPAMVVADEGDSDMAFLPLTDPAFDLSDRGVEGRPPSPPIDMFLTTDRGAYRAGEVIHATALARDAQAQAITGLPVTAILKRPDGVEYSRRHSGRGVAGGHVFALPVGATAPRGTWRLDLHADVDAPPLASRTLLVEDFLPERLDLTLSVPDTPLRAEDTPPLRVQADYLFGAPASDLAVEGEVRLVATRAIAEFPGYAFGRHDQRFDPRTQPLDPATTDSTGAATLALTLPPVDDPGQPIEAQITVRVTEGSGRPVERQVTRPLAPRGPMIGIAAGFDDVLPEGATARFDLIAPGAAPMPVRWTVNRVDTRYQWYQLYGSWNWEPVTRRIRVASGEMTLGDAPQPLSVATQWGDYELVVERLGSAGYAVSSVGFSAGWYAAGDGRDTPDRLDLSLDAPDYSPGDTARLRIVARDDGVALVTVLSNAVIDRKVVQVTQGENLIPLAVTENWGTGAYVTASVLRPMNAQAGRSPARSLGLAHATVRPGIRALGVAIDAPDVVNGQQGPLRATVSVTGIAPGDTAHLTLAAVDLGILNLTGFDSPDPAGHYFGQRRLGVELRDLYGRLIDGLGGALGTVRSGGDAGDALSLQSPPPTEALMAAFSGPVTVGADGTAEVLIDRPAFNGTIRLMAVVWSQRGVGQASRDVIARDPVVVTASLPRFLAPGDDSRLLLEFAHTSGPAGDMDLSVRATGVTLDDVPARVTLPAQGTASLRLPLRAGDVGDHRIALALTAPDGTVLRKTLQVAVRANDPQSATVRRLSLAPGEIFTFDANVLAGLRPGTASATLSAGPLARFDVAGLLHQLDRYPYGCTEQVTSAALPLLYLSSVAADVDKADVRRRVTAAIAEVQTRQAGNGAFGMWSARSGAFWLDAYVTDFLSRARAQGYDVPDLVLATALDNLRNRVNYAPDFDRGGEDIAYALLVLAREGAAAMGDLRYYADTKRDAFGTPLAAAQVGAALAAYGDQPRADAMFRHAGAMLARPADGSGWRDDFGTPLRDAAAVLALAAEAGSSALNQQDLSQRITRAGRSLSTQEAAQVLLAAHALGQSRQGAQGLVLNGVPASGPVVQRLSGPQAAVSTLANTGAAPIDITLATFGVPIVAPPAGGYGYAIERRFFDMEGAPVTAGFAAGDRLVAVLTVTPFDAVDGRLIVDDPLPAGFEIDNPALLRSGDIGALDWLNPAAAEHAEFRSDRFVAAVDHRGDAPFQLAYVLRAVTPGDYHQPAAMVQDMYRPEYRALTATGRVIVQR